MMKKPKIVLVILISLLLVISPMNVLVSSDFSPEDELNKLKG